MITNPYRKYADHIPALVRKVSREHMYDIEPSSKDILGTGNYIASGYNESYEVDLDAQLMEKFKELGEEEPDAS